MNKSNIRDYQLSTAFLFIEMLVEAFEGQLTSYTPEQLTNQTCYQRQLTRCQVVAATILAVLHYTKDPSKDCITHAWNGYISRKKLMTYVDVQTAVKQFYAQKLREYFPGWNKNSPVSSPVSSPDNIRNHCTRDLRKDKFLDCFTEWTRKVSLHRKDLKPLDTTKVDMDHNKFIIHVADVWKKQNPLVTKIVQELFDA